MTVRTDRGPLITIISIIAIVIRVEATESANEVYGNLIKANINASADPCEDFYAYACGNWYRNYNATAYIDMPGYMDYKVNQQLEDLMESEAPSEWTTGIYDKVMDLYESCKQLKELVLNPFLTSVHRELNMQWPIFAIDQGEWKNSTNFDWLRVIAVLRNYGLNAIFISHNVNVNPRNSSEYFLEISQHYASTPLEVEDVENVFINFGMTHNESHSLTQELVEFEKILNGIAKYEFVNETESANYADNYQVYSVKELSEIVPEIDWSAYFQIILNTTENLEKLPIQTFILNREFYTNLRGHLERTSNETIAHYLMLKFMYYLNNQLPHSKPRNCIRYLRGFMPVFMNYLYEQRLFRDKRVEIEKQLNVMFKNLKKSFEKIVRENHLKLSQKEQQFILKELHTMQLKIGNLPRNCSEQFVDLYYQNLTINKMDFVQSHLNLLRCNNQVNYQQLISNNATIDQKIYNLDADSLSSSSPVKIFDNAILVPHGYLQLPLFDARLSELHQYSLLGVILAHEIIHAYDFFHIIYDYNSNYDYMGSLISQHYSPHMHCYSQSPVDIISENIADVSGLRIAHSFYESLAADITFPFLNLTKEQYFFVNSVQFLCADIHKITNVSVETSNLGHDMHDKRVQQNWSKFEEFSLAFNCSPKSNMTTPEESCRIW